MQRSEDGEELEASAEERVRRVSHLNLLGGVVERVLEGGMKIFSRLIPSITRS
jgi:hypothetical protein